MHTKLLDCVYLIGILTATTWVCVFPTWTGQFYNYTTPSDLSWTETYPSGSFGLDGGVWFEKISPIWAPPASSMIDATVRMPWQTISSKAHVEVYVASTLVRFFFCSMVLGLLHRIATALTRCELSRLGSIAWSSSLLAIVSCFVLAAIGMFTMGFGLTDHVVIWVLTSLGLIGILHGTLRHKSKPEAQRGEVALQNASRSRSLGWMVLGGAIGFGLTWITAAMVFHFRPTGGVFGPVDHTGNVIAGAAILLITWTTAFVLWRTVPTGLLNGFLVTATILAAMVCIQF